MIPEEYRINSIRDGYKTENSWIHETIHYRSLQVVFKWLPIKNHLEVILSQNHHYNTLLHLGIYHQETLAFLLTLITEEQLLKGLKKKEFRSKHPSSFRNR